MMKRTGLMLSLVGALALAGGCGKSSTTDSSEQDVTTTAAKNTREGRRGSGDSRGFNAGDRDTRRARPSLPDQPSLGDNTDPASREERRQRGRERMMERFDLDGDGTLSDQERDTMHEQMMTRREEMRAERAERRAEAFKETDADGDGKLTRAELEANGDRRMGRMLRRFDDIDTDKDGAISSEEMATATERRFEGRGGRRGWGGRGERGQGPGAPGDDAPSTDE